MHGRGALSKQSEPGSEVEAIARARDWTASPLGEPSAWPAALRTVVELMVASRFPMFVAWGPELAFLYNEGYRPILGSRHPDALGRPFREVWPEIWDDIAPLVARALAGEATFHENLPLIMERNGYPEETWYTFSYSPVRDETGAIAGVLCACTETTAAVQSNRRVAFQLALDDALRGLADPREVMAHAAALLGRHLGAARVGYGDVDRAQTHIVVERDWTDGRVGSVAGRHRLDDFGPSLIAQLKAGRVVVVPDVADDPRTMAEVGAFDAIGARTVLTVPLVRDGRLTALLYLHDPAPRTWSADQVRLVEDAAERTWGAVERARAEERLRLNEERLRALADNIPGGMVYQAVGHPDGTVRFAYVSQAVERLHGVSADAVIADPGILDAQVLGSFMPQLVAARRQAIAAAGPFEIELPMRRPDGVVRWFRRSAAPRRLPDGSVIWDGVEIDVTGRRRAEEAVRESESRFRALTDLVPVFVWFAGPDGALHYLNDRWYAYTGLTPEQSLPHGWAQTLHPDDMARTGAAWSQALATGTAYSIDVRYRRHDGAYRWYVARAEPLRNADGAIERWFGTSTDIHDARMAAEAVRESEIRFRNMADNAPVMIWMTDPDGTCTYLNRPWYGFTGQTEEQALGLGWLKAAHPDDQAQVQAVFLQSNAMRAPFQIEYRLRRADGSYVWAIDAAAPRFAEDGRFLGYVGSVIDISERKQAEERQQLLINELNHRVKNTLATVQSIAGQTLRNAPTLEEARSSFEGRLFALSRAHDVLTRENWEGAELSEIVAQAVAPYANTREDRLHVAGPPVRLQPRVALALAMALQELATNAVKHGALSNDVGAIRIAWDVVGVTGARRLRLSWAESGGPTVSAPTRHGFGTRLIERSLAHELEADVRIAFPPTGLTCALDAPLDEGRP